MKNNKNNKTETLAAIAVGILIALVATVAFFILLPAVLFFGKNIISNDYGYKI